MLRNLIISLSYINKTRSFYLDSRTARERREQCFQLLVIILANKSDARAFPPGPAGALRHARHYRRAGIQFRELHHRQMNILLSEAIAAR